jgi:hypothetical protein
MGSIPSITDSFNGQPGAIAGAPDNTTPIQNALNSAPEIYLPGGQWNTRPLTIPSTLRRLWGPGQLVGLAAPASAFLSIADRAYAPVDLEEFSISLPSAFMWTEAVQWGRTALRARGVLVNGGRHSFIGTGANGSVVEECLMAGFTQSAVFLQDPNTVWVRSCQIAGNLQGQGGHVIQVHGGSDVVLRDNLIYQATPGGFGTYFLGHSRGSIHGKYTETPNEAIVIDSCVNTSIEPGTKLGWDTAASQDFAISVAGSSTQCRYCSIRGVDIRGNGKNGIFIGNGSGQGFGVKGFLIEGGSIVDVGRLSPGVFDGVALGGDGNEAGIVGTRIFGLTVANDQTNNIRYGVSENGVAQKPSGTKVTCLNAVGLTAGPQLLSGAGSSAQWPG